jgi:hypothetical protein
MKLDSIVINSNSGQVECGCSLNVQNNDFPVRFVLQESDLYNNAAANGNTSWENEDIVAVAKAQLNLDITL